MTRDLINLRTLPRWCFPRVDLYGSGDLEKIRL